MTPGEYLKECRQKAGKSARALSKALGVDDSYISTVERRRSIPDATMLVRLEVLLPEFRGEEMQRLELEAKRLELAGRDRT